jgi:hypothetical protein
LRRIERDLAITSELTATFVRTFLMITPPLPESEHAAARALGKLRYEQMIEEIAKQLRTNRCLIARVMTTMAEARNTTDPDNLRQDDDHATPPSAPVSKRPRPTESDG